MNYTYSTYGTAKRDSSTLCNCSSSNANGTFNRSSMNCRRRLSTSSTNQLNDAAKHHQPRFGIITMNKKTKEK